MNQLTWTAELYGTSIELIDAQHRELFDRINKVLLALEGKKSSSEIAGLLDSLGTFTVKHFSCEEDLMEKRKCEVACANKTAHSHFLKEFQRLRADFNTRGNTPEYLAELSKMVTAWLRSHIMTIDTNLRNTKAD